MTDAERIADAIDRNTKALEDMAQSLAFLSGLYETTCANMVSERWAVDAIVAAIRSKPEP
jgi:hypothetical protein